MTLVTITSAAFMARLLFAKWYLRSGGVDFFDLNQESGARFRGSLGVKLQGGEPDACRILHAGSSYDVADDARASRGAGDRRSEPRSHRGATAVRGMSRH